VSGSRYGLRPWLIGVSAASVLVATLVVVGSWLSQRHFLAIVRAQAEGLTSENGDLIERFAAAVRSGRPKELATISESLLFLSSQRRDLPSVQLIYASDFRGKRALRTVESLSWDPEKKGIEPPFFECDPALDCAYLNSFFDGREVGALNRMDDRDSFLIYLPIKREGARFVLRFGHVQRYGRIGS
jgi:hypothetical protein